MTRGIARTGLKPGASLAGIGLAGIGLNAGVGLKPRPSRCRPGLKPCVGPKAGIGLAALAHAGDSLRPALPESRRGPSHRRQLVCPEAPARSNRSSHRVDPITSSQRVDNVRLGDRPLPSPPCRPATSRPARRAAQSRAAGAAETPTVPPRPARRGTARRSRELRVSSARPVRPVGRRPAAASRALRRPPALLSLQGLLGVRMNFIRGRRHRRTFPGGGKRQGAAPHSL